ncbi:hypothetical protein JCM9279_003537 [Rhodotorula babjevae]
MSASLSNLPDELAKFVAEMVQQDDERWYKLGFVRGVDSSSQQSSHSASEGSEDGEDGVNVVCGRWSTWYGRGLFALSLVNKQVRAVVAPLFYENVHWRQLDTAHFRLHVLGEPLGQLVRHVDLQIHQTVVSCVALACALQKLPHISSLSINGGPSDFCDPHSRTDYAPLLTSRFEQTLGSITALEVRQSGAAKLGTILKHVDGRRLERLELHLSWVPGTGREAIMAKFEHLVGLRTLVIHGFGGYTSRTSLPSLRNVKIRGLTSFKNCLKFVLAVAPNVETLVIESNRRYRAASKRPHKPVGVFQHLRRLSLSGSSRFPQRFLAQDHPRLESMVCDLSSMGPGTIDVKPPPSSTLPSNLRRLVLRVDPLAVVPSLPDLASACTASAVDFSLERRTSATMRAEPFEPMSAPAPFDGAGSAPPLVPSTRPGQGAAVRDTLEWATRRAAWLEALDDGPGLQELAEATIRLRERQRIEQD